MHKKSIIEISAAIKIQREVAILKFCKFLLSSKIELDAKVLIIIIGDYIIY